jgi:ABC-2 type transport system permease protein
MQVAGRFVRPPSTEAYYVVDAGGDYAKAIDTRINLSYQRRVLSDLSAYVERWELTSVDPQAPWAGGQRYLTDEDVSAFIAQGGADAAIARLAPRLPSGAPKFEPQKPAVIRADLPNGFNASAPPDKLGEALRPLLAEDAVTPQGKLQVELAIYIPPDFGPASPARVWTSGRPNQDLISAIRAELTRLLKDKALREAGLSPEQFARIEATNAPITLVVPARGGGREQMQIRSILPLILSYILLSTVMTTGGLMLQGVLEERSNRLLESVLACIRPSDLMYGKLFGLGAVGLTIITVWLGFALGAAFMVQGAVADFLRPALAAFDQLWMIPALIFYFITGYLIISMIYLAIGALSTSLQDAQAYLMPVIFIITLPIVFMMISITQDPDGFLPQLLSWIPIYTPFAMLGRFGGGVSIGEVLGTGALLTVFVIIEMWALGKLFQDSILRTGQGPALAGVVKKIFGRTKLA